MPRITGGSPPAAAVVVAGWILITASDAYGEEINRIDWSPGGGIVGDLWKFRCPAGGSVSVLVDTFGDLPGPDDDFQSGLDPALAIYDGRGNLLAAGDDEFDCFAPTRCGASCPSVTVPCSQGTNNHTIVVRDAGVLADCEGGGSYLLTVEVINRNGTSLAESKVNLGGGEERNLPQWLVDFGAIGSSGPLVNDGFAPTLFGNLTTNRVGSPKQLAKIPK